MLSVGESERVEFKHSLPRPADLLRDVVAFANTRGGTILVGVRDDGRVVGVSADLAALDRLIAYVRTHTDPPLEIVAEPELIDDHRVVLLHVQRSPQTPVLVADAAQAYVRTGTSARLARRADLERLVLEAHPGSFEDASMSNAAVADLDETRIRDYLRRRGSTVDQADLVQLLRNLGFLSGADGSDAPPAPTAAAVLLFARAPQRFLPQARVELARFPGREPVPDADRATVEGTLPEQVEGVLTFVQRHMRVATRVEGFLGEGVPEYPLEVVRELITNAAVHRDYSLRGMATQIWLFHDRWEVTSPGRLPGGLTPADLESGASLRVSRNPRLAEAMRVLGYGDGLGFGLQRVRNLLESARLVPARFTEHGDAVTLTLSGAADAVRRAAQLRHYRNQLAHGGGQPRQLQALDYLLRHPAITNAEYRQLTGVSEVTALRDLTELVEQGLLVRHGAKRGAYYALAVGHETGSEAS
jgi:ATP-dependent DNA helicase RecG